MGAFDYEERPPNQSTSGPWNVKSWEQDNQNSEQRFPACPTGNGSAVGLTTYRALTDKDFDRLSTYSSDDACSNADSVFDTSSVISSQSTYSSAISETSDDAFEAGETYSKQPLDATVSTLDKHREFQDQAELLTGLGARSTANIHGNGYSLAQQHGSTQAVPRSHPTFAFPSKCNRRRSGSYDSTNGPPCRLKRDTDSADCFVMLLITFAARLITAIWPLSASPPMMSSCFNGAGVLPLEVFIHETLRRSKTSYSTLQVALFYIILLKDKLSDRDFTKEQPRPEEPQQQPSGPSTCRAMQCGRRMFLAALMLASKYLQDRNYSTRAWSKISGLRIPEINENETEYLKSIDYRLHMKKETFENWSKIVLTLSKLSKLQPGCSSRLDSFRNSGSGADAMFAALSSGASPHRSADDPVVYSNLWWSDLMKKLEPEVVSDSSHTDAFLRNNVPLDDVADLLSRHDTTLPTPPTSPEASPPHVLDMTFNEALPSRNGATPKLPAPTEIRAPSPARSAVLPMRPQLRNLPTPQSTPRGTDPCPWLTTPGRAQQNLHCSASLDALRAMRKQCILNANLERCPPPQRPHSLALPPVRSTMRPAESNQACYSRSATPAVFSPASSVLAESTPRTTRSRSSSISSNSSWSSWASGPPRSLQAMQTPSQTSSPLARVVSTPEDSPSQVTPMATPVNVLRRKPNFSSDRTPLANQMARSNLATFHDEGYGSGEDPVARNASQNFQSGDEVDAIQALLTMSSTHAHYSYLRHSSMQSTQSPRGHKRTISKTNDSLQGRVSELLHSQSIEDQVMEDVKPTTHDAKPDRQWQKPTKQWARPKRPAPNPMDTKRMALYCAMQEPSAPQLAAQYLKDQMITV